jgi:uncharacterized protein
MEEATRPRPDVRGAGAQYWSAAKSGALQLPRCGSCRRVHWYPRVRCPHCGSADIAWITASGRGTVHTYTVVRQSGDAYFKTKVPYVLAMIDLEEGVRVMSNIVGCEVGAVAVGSPVRAVFEDDGIPVDIPLFQLASAPA